MTFVPLEGIFVNGNSLSHIQGISNPGPPPPAPGDGARQPQDPGDCPPKAISGNAKKKDDLLKIKINEKRFLVLHPRARL